MTEQGADSGLLEFARVQARPNLIFGRPASRAGGAPPLNTPIRVASPSVVSLGAESCDLLATTPFPLPANEAHATARSARLRALIVAAAGFQRHEPSNAFNAHRAIPSAQSKFPTELFLGVGPNTWHYDSSWDGLRPVGEHTDGDPWAALDDGAPAFLAILGRPGRLPDYYRELQWALTLCEAGHLAAMAAQLARVLGFGTEVLTDFDDQGLLERIGAMPGDAWLPGVVIGLDGTRPEFPRSSQDWPGTEDPVLAADRQAWHREPEPVPPSPSPSPSSSPPQAVDGSATQNVASRSWSSVMFHRSAGRAPAGLTASPEPLAHGVLASALNAASTAAADWARPGGPPDAGVEIYAVVERTDGVESGIYSWEPGSRSLLMRRPGSHLAAVQTAFFYPQTVTRVDTCNVAMCCVVDYAAALATEGPRGLRLTQLRLGGLMQASAMVCASRDVFLRPCRSYDPDALSGLLTLRPEQTVGYLCLLGRSRFTDLMLDMRPVVGA